MNPSYLLFIVKFINLLDYIKLINVELPKNVELFLNIIQTSPTALIPSIFEDFAMEDDACELERKIENDGWKCSSFKNSYAMYYFLVAFSLLCIVNVIFQKCFKKQDHGDKKLDEEEKETQNLKQLFS